MNHTPIKKWITLRSVFSDNRRVEKTRSSMPYHRWDKWEQVLFYWSACWSVTTNWHHYWLGAIKWCNISNVMHQRLNIIWYWNAYFCVINNGSAEKDDRIFKGLKLSMDSVLRSLMMHPSRSLPFILSFLSTIFCCKIGFN